MPPDMTSQMKMLTPDTSAYKQLQEFKVPLNGNVKEFLAFENGSELSQTQNFFNESDPMNNADQESVNDMIAAVGYDMSNEGLSPSFYLSKIRPEMTFAHCDRTPASPQTVTAHEPYISDTVNQAMSSVGPINTLGRNGQKPPRTKRRLQEADKEVDMEAPIPLMRPAEPVNLI